MVLRFPGKLASAALRDLEETDLYQRFVAASGITVQTRCYCEGFPRRFDSISGFLERRRQDVIRGDGYKR